MTDDIAKIARGPRRRIVATIKIEADNWKEMKGALHVILTDLAIRGTLPTNSVSGGYSAGWSIDSSEDETVTHDSWYTELNAYLEGLSDHA